MIVMICRRIVAQGCNKRWYRHFRSPYPSRVTPLISAPRLVKPMVLLSRLLARGLTQPSLKKHGEGLSSR